MVKLQNYKRLLNILGLGTSTSNRRTSIANSHIFSDYRGILYLLPTHLALLLTNMKSFAQQSYSGHPIGVAPKDIKNATPFLC